MIQVDDKLLVGGFHRSVLSIAGASLWGQGESAEAQSPRKALAHALADIVLLTSPECLELFELDELFARVRDACLDAYRQIEDTESGRDLLASSELPWIRRVVTMRDPLNPLDDLRAIYDLAMNELTRLTGGDT